MFINFTSKFRTYLCFLICCFFSYLSHSQCPTIPSSPIVICDGAGFNFADLDAFASSGSGDINWYNASGSIQYTDLQLVTQGTYFADDSSNSCGGSRPSITVDFTVDPSGVSLFNGIYCTADNATFNDYLTEVVQPFQPPTTVSIQLYYNITLTSPVNLTDPIPLGFTNLFIVFTDNNGCTSQIERGRTAVDNSPPDPTPPTPQQFCSDTNPTVGNLNPGTTGTFNWYANVDGSGAVIPPALNSTTPLVNGNTYYVQTETFFCDSNPVAVIVEIEDPVNAGVSGFLDYCEDSVPTTDINLFDQLGSSAETTGTWTGPLPTTNGHLGTINITGLPANTYVFTYTVLGGNACPNATANVTITIYPILSAGTVSNNSPALFCESLAPSAFDLNSLLDNEDSGGQWTQGTLSTDPIVTSPINLTTFTPGVYNFTYTQNIAPNTCPEDSETVQVEILADPNPGVAINAEFCENDLTPNPFDLFDALDGSQDNNSGTWTDASGNIVTNPIDISTFTVAGSPYIFTYTISNGTCEDSENISLTVLPAPESGTVSPNSPLAFCLATAPSAYNLFDLLDGEDQTGTWYIGTDNTGTAAANPVDLSVLAVGTYNFTFDVDAVGTCDDELVTVQIVINDLPNTGTPNNPAPFCENDPALNNNAFDLFDILNGEDAGGTWSDDDASGVLTGNTIDLSSLPVGTYNYTYSITNANTCSNSTTVTITILEAPESGTVSPNNPLAFCLATAPSAYNLFDLLDGEDQTGTWYIGTDNTGTVTANPVDLSVLTVGTYNFTFDVDAIGTCDDELVTVQIIINDLPNTGTATPYVVCETTTDTAFDLFNQLSGNDAGGIWSDDDTTGVLTGNTIDLTGLPIGTYNFTYTITDTNTCTNSTTVSITIEEAPEAGTGTNFEICSIDVATTPTLDLFNQLSGNDAGGTWTDDNASGALSGNVVDLTLLPVNTTFNFTYTVTGTGTCANDTEIISVIVNETAPPTIVDTNQEFCDSATVGDLTATGNNIQWYNDATLGTALNSGDILADGGTYYASQTDATTNCESSVRTQVTVTIYLSSNSGIAVNDTICNDESAYDLFTALDGSQDATGTWTDTDGTGALSGNTFDASMVTPGDYNFTYTVVANAPCVNASTVVTITVEIPVSAGTDNTLLVCSTDTTVDLFPLLGGATPGGGWSLNGNPVTNTLDPSTANSGIYTYTIAGVCNFETAQIDVTITPAPNAGMDNTTDICVSDGPIDLLTLLNGTPDTTGTWSPLLTSGTNIFDPELDGSNTYTYTVNATSPCSVNAMASVTVTVNNAATPTTTVSDISLCTVDNPTVADLNTYASGNNLQWFDTATSTTPLASTDVLINGEDYYATQTDPTSLCISSVRAQINVTISDAATPTLITDGELFCINDNPTIGTLTANILEVNSNLDNIVWYDANINGTLYLNNEQLVNDQTYYAVLIDSASLCESSVRLMVTVDLSACGTLNIPDGFSPNGDGVNDSFTIENIEFLYPNYNIEFYNRYGNLVYKTDAKNEDFKGISNQSRVLNNSVLPVGVYYYILNYNDGKTKAKQGRLYLNR